MGASKRVTELCLQCLYNNHGNKNLKYCIVRFGNVLESSGSLVPKVKYQIKLGGPVTLTHPDVTRYFMTISEAAELVIQAGSMAEGADVFLLDMGEPIKIKSLIEKMILLSGHSIKDKYNNDGDIEIETIGLRPGEKLFEELLINGNLEKTVHSKIFKTKEPFIKIETLNLNIDLLQKHIKDCNEVEILSILKKLVPDFKRKK